MFRSMNFTQITCTKCGAMTQIEPGRHFKGLNCKCNVEESEAYKEIKVFSDGNVEVEALGVFKNGDIEVRYTDGTMSYRVPAKTFAKDFEEVQDETAEKTEDNQKETSVSEEVDPSNTVTLSLNDLKGMTPDEIKDAYNMDELRVLAKASKIRGATQMNEDKLVGKLLAKAE